METPQVIHKLSSVIFYNIILTYFLFSSEFPWHLVRIKSRKSSTCTVFFFVLYNLKKKSFLLRILPQQMVSVVLAEDIGLNERDNATYTPWWKRQVCTKAQQAQQACHAHTRCSHPPYACPYLSTLIKSGMEQPGTANPRLSNGYKSMTLPCLPFLLRRPPCKASDLLT